MATLRVDKWMPRRQMDFEMATPLVAANGFERR
jgi:hypothetical protein